MAVIPFLTDISLNQNELQNVTVHNLAIAPSSPTDGQIYYNTADGNVYVWDGVANAWVDMTSQGTGSTNITISYTATTVVIESSTGTNGTINLADGTTAGVSENNLTDAEKTILGNTSGTNTGDQTATLTAGVGLSGTTYDPNTSTSFDLDFTELTDMTADVVSTTEIILNDAGTESRKAISEIKLSIFNNDSSWTDNTGTVESVSAGNGMTFSTITSTGSVTLGTPSTLTSSTTNSVTADSHTHVIDISGFNSTSLADTANIVYTNAARTISVTHTIATGSKLTLTDAPVADTDAANKGYVDSVAQGLNTKESVLAMSDANLDLSGAETIDGVSVTAGDRVLVTGQTNLAENGIYVAATGAWSRADDANNWDELVSAFVFVEEGTTYGDTGWVCTVDTGGTLGTTDVIWAQFSGAGSYTAGDGLDLTGTEFTLTTPTTNLSGSSTNAVAAGGHTHAIDTGITNGSIVAVDGSPNSGEFAKFTANGLEGRTLAEMISDLSIPQKFSVDLDSAEGAVSRVNAGGETTFTITHNLGSLDVVAKVREISTNIEVGVVIEPQTTSTLDVVVNDSGNTNNNLYRVVIIG